MRLTIILVLLLIFAVPVHAVGIGFPGDLDQEEYIDGGDELTYTFFLRGDADEHDVRFFVKSLDPDVVEVEGGAEYTRVYNLNAYEGKYIDVDIEGVGDGETDLEYGFVYLPNAGDEDGVGFEQVVSNTFFIEVDGDGARDDTTNDTDEDYTQEDYDNDYGSGTSGGAGGGGGGGGGGGAALLEALSGEDDEDLQEAPGSTDSAALTDISAQGSPTNEMVAAPPPVQRKVAVTETSSGDPEGVSATGGVWILVSSIMFFIATASGLVLRSKVKGED